MKNSHMDVDYYKIIISYLGDMKASDKIFHPQLLLLLFICSYVTMILTGCQSMHKVLKSGDELPVVENDKPKKAKKANGTDNDKITVKDEKGKPIPKTPEHPVSDNIYKKKKNAGNNDNVSTTELQVETIIKTAESFLGTPYAWGGMSRKGVDCSGLVVLAYKSVNKPMARVSGDQAKGGVAIHKNQLRKGDILFFSSSKKGIIGHSAIVVEVKNNSVKFIHAANSGVRYDYLESEHWSNKFICARRYCQ